jgi:hypothetical protein
MNGAVRRKERLHLPLETLQLAAVQERMLGQDFERHMPAQGDLHRLVDNAHAATAHLAQHLVIAQPL